MRQTASNRRLQQHWRYIGNIGNQWNTNRKYMKTIGGHKITDPHFRLENWFELPTSLPGSWIEKYSIRDWVETRQDPESTNIWLWIGSKPAYILNRQIFDSGLGRNPPSSWIETYSIQDCAVYRQLYEIYLQHIAISKQCRRWQLFCLHLYISCNWLLTTICYDKLHPRGFRIIVMWLWGWAPVPKPANRIHVDEGSSIWDIWGMNPHQLHTTIISQYPKGASWTCSQKLTTRCRGLEKLPLQTPKNHYTVHRPTSLVVCSGFLVVCRWSCSGFLVVCSGFRWFVGGHVGV